MLALCFVSLALAADSKPTFQHSAPATAKPNVALTLDGSLAAGAPFEKIVLLYRGPGEEYVETTMKPQYGDLLRAVIPPARMVTPGIEYYVEGRTKQGERIALFMTAGKPARVLVLSPEPDSKKTK